MGNTVSDVSSILQSVILLAAAYFILPALSGVGQLLPSNPFRDESDEERLIRLQKEEGTLVELAKVSIVNEYPSSDYVTHYLNWFSAWLSTHSTACDKVKTYLEATQDKLEAASDVIIKALFSSEMAELYWIPLPGLTTNADLERVYSFIYTKILTPNEFYSISYLPLVYEGCYIECTVEKTIGRAFEKAARIAHTYSRADTSKAPSTLRSIFSHPLARHYALNTPLIADQVTRFYHQ